MRCQFAAKPGKIESSIDLPHQMIFGNRLAKMKLVEQLTLVTLQTAHHGSTSPRFASTQRNHGWSPVSTDFCKKICKRQTFVVDGGRVMLSLPRPTASCGLRDFLLASLLHGAHVEIEHALALVALFLVLLSKFDDFFEDLHVEPFAFGLRKHFLLLFVQLLDFSV